MRKFRLPSGRSSRSLYCSQVSDLTLILRDLLILVPIILVAHRLRTVIDYDRLIVLDKGEVRIMIGYEWLTLTRTLSQVAEFDTPLKLIQKEDGIFRMMCLKSGTFAELEAAAKVKAERDVAEARA
jgi:energy-coupling factor transporter ATP-binding protein EcfA2